MVCSKKPKLAEIAKGEYKIREIDVYDFYDMVNTQNFRIGTFFLFWCYLIFWGVCGYFRHVLAAFSWSRLLPNLISSQSEYTLYSIFSSMLNLNVVSQVVYALYAAKELLAVALIMFAPFWVYRYAVNLITVSYWSEETQTTPSVRSSKAWTDFLKESRKKELVLSFYCYFIWLISFFLAPFWVICKLHGIYRWVFGRK